MPDWSIPAALPLPDELRRPDITTQRRAMRWLAGAHGWRGLRWPELVDALIALGRTDIPLSRLAEGHIDALRILTEGGLAPVPDALYGVWASRSEGTGLTFEQRDGRWHLTGELRFASGAGLLDRALVTAWTPDGSRHVLLDCEVKQWSFDEGDWRTRAMELSRSHRVRLDHPVEARQVDSDNFYLRRWGFHPGGIGVAAVWTGCAARVLDLLGERAGSGEQRVARLGRARTELVTAVALVRQGALAVQHRPADPRPVATGCRAGVAAAIRRLLDEVRTLAGPAGLAFDEELTRAVDDLAMFVAQQGIDSDAHYLGSLP
ncbi:hypothetical protein [Enemella sp. A6]|uniref:hypothetical protein n=1 Tax=Enemella sp. A6 TaxID=3440152 RepID=UPI003EBE56FA